MTDPMSEQDIARSHRWHAVECNKQLGEGIKDPEDKAIFAASFALIPGP